MKKRIVWTGLLSVLLIAGMMFTACPMDSGSDSGGSKPKPEDLPELPPGTDYVADETEALALLGALKSVTSDVSNEVGNLINAAGSGTEDDYSWKITNDTSIPSLKINAEGRITREADPDNFMQEDYDEPEAGDYGEGSRTENTTVEFTANKSASGVVVYAGSRTRMEESASMKTEIKAVLEPSVTFTESGSNKETVVYRLTASSNGKGGKIILGALAEESLTREVEEDPWDGSQPSPDYSSASGSYSGSLKVFGADNALVYELPITNRTTYRQALGYFKGS
jgi:hypothetical protein